MKNCFLQCRNYNFHNENRVLQSDNRIPQGENHSFHSENRFRQTKNCNFQRNIAFSGAKTASSRAKLQNERTKLEFP
jgi:hypothetical protein